MSYGYSARLIGLNKKADKKRLGVRLGKRCIELDIPVADVAIHMGVSRQTVYNWFSGVHDPKGLCVTLAEQFLTKLTNRK